MALAVASCHTLIFTTLSQNNILPNVLSLMRRGYPPPPPPLPHTQQETSSFSRLSSGATFQTQFAAVVFVFTCRCVKGARQVCLITPSYVPAGRRWATLQERYNAISSAR